MITRRQFLRRGALWVPSLAVAKATLAQAQYLQNRRKAFRGTAPVTPPVAGYTAWWTTPIAGLNDGDAVATWPDSSGNGHSAVQVTGSKQPIYKTAIQNGLDVVRFDTTDDYLATTAIDFTGTQGMSAFLAGNIAGTTADYRVFLSISTNYSVFTTAWEMMKTATTGYMYGRLTGDVGASQQIYQTNMTGLFSCVSFVVDKSLSSAEAKLFVNATSSLQSTDSNNSNAFGNHAVYFGMRGGTAYPSGMDAGEIIVYSTALDAAGRQSVENYLKSKWGL